MKQAIAEITKRLAQHLPDEHAFFTPEDLLEAGMPDFLVARIRLTLRQQLSRAIAPPRVEWADAGVPEAEQAWRQFFNVLHQHVRLPRKRAARILEDAVSDVLHLLCEPREYLPRYLFAGDAVLSLKEARERAEWVVVYPQLGQFLPKYMQARKLEVISRARYENALRQLDDKLVSRYQPGDWLNLLSPLFVLFDHRVPADLLQRFFEDKARYGIAERLEQQQEEVLSQGVLLSFLSSESKTGAEAEPKQEPAAPPAQTAEISAQEVREARAARLPSQERPAGESPLAQQPEESQEKPSSEKNDDETPAPAEGPEPAAEAAETPADAPPKEKNAPENSGENELPAEALPEAGQEAETPDVPEPEKQDEEEQNEEEQKQKEGTEEDPLATFLNFNFKRSEEDETPSLPEKPEAPEESAVEPGPSEPDSEAEQPEPESSPAEEDEDIKETPLYARFNAAKDEDNEIDEDGQGTQQQSREAQRRASKQHIPPLSAPSEEPADDENMPLWKRLSLQNEAAETPGNETPAPETRPSQLSKELAALRQFLGPKEEKYVADLFEEDVGAYEEALERLAGFKNWREAGKYITNEIFRKRGINMYGESAVEFTDRLHKYFMARQS